jgi:hypothetical protein
MAQTASRKFAGGEMGHSWIPPGPAVARVLPSGLKATADTFVPSGGPIWLAASGQSWRAAGRSLVGHQDVGDIVHQGRHRHGVDRLQVEDDPGLEVMQHLGIKLVQMRGAHVVGAHDDHFP